jgi:two-component system, OmpR family, sensor kinase
MRSLQARLAVTYGVFAAVASILIILASAELAFRVEARPITRAVELSAMRAREIAFANAGLPKDAVIARIVREAAVRGALVVGPLEGSTNARFATTRTGKLPVPNLGGRIKAALGLRVETVQFDDTGVLVLPDARLADVIVYKYAKLAAVAIVLALVGSFLLGRWIANHAVSPLVKVTAELRRFASGDFTPRALAILDCDELGELTDAYNHAAAQVSAAFRERQCVEEQMRRFIGDAGHELKTPLTAISGFHQLLQSGGVDDPIIRERAFCALSKETRRMHLLVERLVSLTRMESDETVRSARINLVDVTRDAIAHVSASRPGIVRFHVNGPVTVDADVVEIDAAIGNLVDNALKYGDGSDVTVDVRFEEGDALVRVSDHGPGIAHEERERIFDRFYRGDHGGSIDGSGLGLSIVAKAAKRAGGRVVLERADPGNTSFALVLPAAREA